MSAARPPVFLERQSYRHRRLIDASRVVPVFGLMLFLVPLLWPQPQPEAQGAPGQVALAGRGLYLFLAWGGLVAVTALISQRLRSRLAAAAPPPARTGGEAAEGVSDGAGGADVL
ncbi:hypothetical protein [Mangrovicoccus algicola]|uniref:hypothetical protein n=1 Tax=Mangrovicoccus algicola TaxID=2771008 RepID=UPI001D032965|nr:hypothetical protein [Mangrovicoccus algicola]